MTIKKITVNERDIYVNVDSICFATYQTSIKNTVENGEPVEIYRVVFNNNFLDIPKGSLEELIGSLTQIEEQNNA